MRTPAVLMVIVLLAGCADGGGDDGAPVTADPAGSDAVAWTPRESGASPSSEATRRMCLVCDHVLDTGPYTWEPSGALDPTDSDHYAIAFRADEPAIEVHVTFDAGVSWRKAVLPLANDDAPYTHSGDAVTFFAPDGTLYVGGLGIRFEPDAAAGTAYERDGADIIVARSDDGGRTFGAPVVVAAGSGGTRGAADILTMSLDYQNQDRPWFAAGPGGRMVAAWNELGMDGPYGTVGGVAPFPYDVDQNVFQVATSDDGGATWSAPRTLGPSGWPGATVLPDGTFVVAHSSHRTGELTLYQSTDGAKWEATEGPVLLGQPVVRALGEHLVVAGTLPYDGQRAPGYRVLTRGGWAGPYIFGNTSASDPFTNLAVHDGALWFSWYDDGTYRFAVAADPESPWPTQRYVAASGFDAATGQYGDYVDTLGAADRVVVAWGATRGDERRIHVSVY